MDDIKIVIEREETSVNVIINENGDGTDGVAKLREELGNIDTDLALLFKIGMDL